jgi:RNA polymerase sigma-70 factor (ECF subfamily)
MGNKYDAEDCAQETLLRAYRAFLSFRGEARLSTWLYAIAARVCMDALRAKRPGSSLDDLMDAGWEKEDDAPSPYMALEENERKAALGKALEELPDLFRAVVVLCDLQGLTYEEAAQALSIPIGTVRSRLNRARKMLLKQLSDYGELFLDETRLNGERRDKDELQ